MITQDSDQMLDAAQQGDRGALDRLLRRYRPQVLRHGQRVCRHPGDAEDAVQETLWSAARAIGQFRRASSISTWLLAIVHNACVHLNRRHQREGAELDQAVGRLEASGPSGEEAAANHEVEMFLVKALMRIETSYREIILLRDVQGLRAPEVAELLGIRVAAVKSRLHRARAALREIVDGVD